MTDFQEDHIRDLEYLLNACERELAAAKRMIWWLVRQQPNHEIMVYPTMHRDADMRLDAEHGGDTISDGGIRLTAWLRDSAYR